MRVVVHFRPVSNAVRRLAAVGLALSLAATWVAEVRSAPLIVVAFLFFVWLIGYDARAFYLGARAAGGVTHWRMLHAAWGALLLAMTFVLTVVASTARNSAGVAAGFAPLSALGAALNYYFAFAPPPWLRRTWQSAELYGFLAERGEGESVASETEVAQPPFHLCDEGRGNERRCGGALGRAAAAPDRAGEPLGLSGAGQGRPRRAAAQGVVGRSGGAGESDSNGCCQAALQAASTLCRFRAASRLVESCTWCCRKARCSCRTISRCCGFAVSRPPCSWTTRR